MADIRTTSQEFTASGSLKNPEQILTTEELNHPLTRNYHLFTKKDR